METTTIKVDGMSCGGCVKSVTGVLTALDGVAKAEVSLEQKQAVVEFDAGKVTRDQLKAVTADQVIEGTQRGRCALAHGNDDLLVRHGRASPAANTRRAREVWPLASTSISPRGRVERALQPVGVGQQADLDEDAFQFDAFDVAPSRGPCRTGRSPSRRRRSPRWSAPR
jgi:copper chaperone